MRCNECHIGKRTPLGLVDCPFTHGYMSPKSACMADKPEAMAEVNREISRLKAENAALIEHCSEEQVKEGGSDGKA